MEQTVPSLTFLNRLFHITICLKLDIKVVTKSGFLWDTHQQEAIEKGNLIHNIMSKIKTKEDIEIVFNVELFSMSDWPRGNKKILVLYAFFLN